MELDLGYRCRLAISPWTRNSNAFVSTDLGLGVLRKARECFGPGETSLSNRSPCPLGPDLEL